jgi:tRNA (adenine57-N1/adenine58-N1)-methyltransferase catalytic subunit
VVEIRDVYEGIDSPEPLDRVVLDLPEPWRVVKHAEAALRPGGIFLSYLPTIGQVTRLWEELSGSAFGMAETQEILQRSWHVAGQSVRPDHRMVAHTGFLTAARLLDVGPGDRP